MHIHFNKKHRKYHKHGGKTLDIDQYAVQSGLVDMNPDLKLLTGVLSLVLCLMSPNGITAIVVAVFMLYITLYHGKLKALQYFNLILIPLFFITLSGLVLLVDFSKKKFGFFNISILGGYLIVTQTSMKTAFLVSTRALCSITCLYMISLSTPLFEIIGVLRKYKVPEIIIELMYLIYRFIFILLEAYHNMKTAADTRLGYCNIKRSYYSFFGICSNLFVIAFQKASKSFDAMEARGYNGNLKFLEKDKPVKRLQIVFFLFYCFIMFMILVLERIGIWQKIF
ncbi:cobalt/nickel transport system permease protein [Lachnotalea glycerini]|uniref:Cobalt ECF transporter T component CbiQ n=1 Tax=Lachnotalea glycerini TaxID=1763509 RepID=A0A255ICV9_9FIRM|nr:cobalt ECF transporter T component CbiQ [Lachnotalea glycerini]PXV96145.1 cobalt/nickel transport system permease protein [Lachnotalea glycerini]RDY31279.1 cobalt ECF transporter T component CbiQ [Lachnotalea glycerini]